jgi:hypothetical protein
MKTPPDPLDPLFRWSRAARQAPAPETPPPGFATRVLAEFRAPAERDWLLWLLPRVVTVAAVLTAVGWMVPVPATTAAPEDELMAGLLETALPSQP